MVTAKLIDSAGDNALDDAGGAASLPSPRPHAPEHLLDPSAQTWADLYPFAPNYVNVGTAGDPHWLHYLDEGPKDAPVVVMCHGNPTWSFMYRDVVKALRDGYRCIVPDHMGCGLSDRPQEWTYRLEDHAANLGKLISHLKLGELSLIMHDWGGMIGSTWAVDHASQIKSIVVLNTAAFVGKLPFRIWTVRIPVFGKTAVLGFNAFVRAAMASCTNHKDALNELSKAGYLAPYGSPHDRIATLRFVEDVPLDPAHPTWKVVDEVDGKLDRLRENPMLVCWGEKDWCFTPTFRKGWQKRFPEAEVHAYDDAAHFVLEDARDRVLAKIRPFLDRTLAA